ncbi:MAG: DUF192 domain-containing protein [bacterium]|nr:DUF192 domain-containing protein [bacterium]
MACLIDQTQRCLVAARVVRAESAWRRTVGLLGRRRIDDDDGLWFDRCSAVHTVGMLAPIDILFLDECQRLVRIVEATPSGRIYVGYRRAFTVVELAAGAARRSALALGDLLTLDDTVAIGDEAERRTACG